MTAKLVSHALVAAGSLTSLVTVLGAGRKW